MIFTSPLFILLFLPISFFGYFFLNYKRWILAGKLWLVAVSLFFYSYWNIAYLPLLLGSIAFNYLIGRLLIAGNCNASHVMNKKVILSLGIAINLMLLGYFKYTNFLVNNLSMLVHAHYELPPIILPLGISFFTFTQIAYLVDSYRGGVKEYNLVNYALFVTFFPHLIAGPILHHEEMMSQFESRWSLPLRHRNILQGLFIFSIGLFKKVIIADTFAIWANAGFDSSVPLDFFTAWATSLSYTFQIYFDFSGYCDMAIGLGLLFNIKLPLNFNSPYKATNIQDFWRRWHITLSRFLRDYLYISLGGNRCSSVRVYFNLMVTFILGGLWHGASWMFIIWGALHGFALVVHRAWSKLGIKMPQFLALCLTFLFINFTWIFFRAQHFSDAKRVLKGMTDYSSMTSLKISEVSSNNLEWAGWLPDYLLGWLPTGIVANLLCFSSLLFGFVIIIQKNSFELSLEGNQTVKFGGALILLCLAMYSAMAVTSPVFLYFNF